MKYLLLLVVLAVAIHLWRRRSDTSGDAPPRPAPPPAVPEPIVACSHCGTHVPQREALAGASGRHYCSPAHRDAGEAR